MRNLLSLKPGTQIKGKEIKDWILYQLEHQTSHYNNARKMQKYLNIDNEKMYIISKGTYEASERQFLVINKEK